MYADIYIYIYASCGISLLQDWKVPNTIFLVSFGPVVVIFVFSAVGVKNILTDKFNLSSIHDPMPQRKAEELCIFLLEIAIV